MVNDKPITYFGIYLCREKELATHCTTISTTFSLYISAKSSLKECCIINWILESKKCTVAFNF